MSSDWQYIEDHMGGHDEDGLPNFMSEPGFNDDSYHDEDSYDNNSSDEDYDNEKNEYDIGNMVRLNSGGPLMTIEEIDDEVITCRWFDTDNNLHSSQFYKNEVKLDTENGKDKETTWYSCGVCDWSGEEDELDSDGDCPKCESLCYKR